MDSRKQHENPWNEFVKIKRRLLLIFLVFVVGGFPIDHWLQSNPRYYLFDYAFWIIFLPAFVFYGWRYMNWKCPRCSAPFQRRSGLLMQGFWILWPRKNLPNS